MTKETINRITVLFSFFFSLLSSLLALATGGDLFFVIIERFFVVFAISGFLVWTALTIINSVIIGAARNAVSVSLGGGPRGETMSQDNPSLAEILNLTHEAAVSKGKNLDLTSAPHEDVLGLSDISEGEEDPEIKEFEPFKPRKIETDRDNKTL